jgi:hypothetical protein
VKKLLVLSLLALASLAFSESAIAIRSDFTTANNSVTMRAQRQVLVFQLPESRTFVRLTLSDMQGRVVWTRRVAPGESRTQIWSMGSSGIVPGNYAVRAVGMTGTGESTLLESRFTYAP